MGGFIQNITLGIDFQRKKLELMPCTVFERQTLLYHNLEQIDW